MAVSLLSAGTRERLPCNQKMAQRPAQIGTTLILYGLTPKLWVWAWYSIVEMTICRASSCTVSTSRFHLQSTITTSSLLIGYWLLLPNLLLSSTPGLDKQLHFDFDKSVSQWCWVQSLEVQGKKPWGWWPFDRFGSAFPPCFPPQSCHQASLLGPALLQCPGVQLCLLELA